MKNLKTEKTDQIKSIKTGQGTDWQKSILLILIIIFVCFIFASLYLAFFPPPTVSEKEIKNKAKETEVIFDLDTLQEIRERQIKQP